MHTTLDRLWLYVRLVRLDKPIGTLLLLWPTLNGVWIASHGNPSVSLVSVFVAGTVLMRSVGCAINDYADRNYDLHVQRTKTRPLTSGRIAAWEALAVAGVLAAAAFLLVVPLNMLTRILSVCALFLACSYPFTKRFFAMPQAYLGIAFGFGIPMAFSSICEEIPTIAWVMLVANLFWSIAYDTEYAMVDRDDDVRIGIRSAAVALGRYDIVGIMFCYVAMLGIYAWLGYHLHLGAPFWLGWATAVGCGLYHYRLIKTREREKCFAAFLHNNWLGGVLFAGIAASYLLQR